MSGYRGIGGGGFPYRKPASSGNNMNAVPPPPVLNSRGYVPRGGGAVGAAGRGIPPLPSASGTSKQGYTTLDSISQYTNSTNFVGKRKQHTDDDYFDEDDEQQQNHRELEQAYIPAPGSPGATATDKKQEESDSDEDPLEQFMAGINQQVEKEKVRAATQQPKATSAPQLEKGVRGDIDDEDDEESYYRYMEENPNAGLRDDGSDQEIEYDEDGNPIAPPKKKDIDPLPTIYHSEIEYEPFEKNFYTPHEEIATLDEEGVRELRHTLGVKVTGPSPPNPVTSFGHFGFDEQLIKAVRKAEYTQPTPIQAQAVPTALAGRDIIGIAKTGSGKTAAFIWPLLMHLMDQRELKPGDGPIGLILAPTRELSLQIYNEAKKFGKVYNINVVCCYGGGSKWEQSKALEQGAEIVVATPGRMIDMVKMKATNLRRVTFLVLDEADRMFHMGFEPQVRSICNHVRPDRQTLLFSATFKKRIERLARDVLSDPVRIVQGDLNEANQDITQSVFVFPNPLQKWNWLLCHLVKFLSEGSVLIFVTKKADAETVANNLLVKEHNCLLLHGDMDQADRNKVITQFKRKECDILVATDVAARGLDIPHIRNVVNYDIARDIDTHTHRIGRTGRAGEKGNAFTLVTDKDKEFAGHLVRNLEGADQEVPEDLMELALKSSWFRSSRFKQGKGKKVTKTYTGLGYREPPHGGGGSGGRERRGSRDRSSSGDRSPPSRGSSRPGSSTDNPFTKEPRPASSGGPATDRYAAMREAFRNQYSSQFRASSDRTWEETVPQTGVFAAPAPPPAPGSSSSSSSSSGNNKDDSKRAKKSRWN
ncbi:ATP-dependent RNA helicase DDX42 [Drosophila guanche]|uniref:ATP-dependent RNA helicase DDX42 n=1 Tax=Drosophila guanche TaxID=7266 RepID=A0A3B0KA40_DROGU|nr:ATP-dependent RNA helicase DDX42 [Drosophila guanche]SPP84980.1 blast:ATP-dependent RNA helicase DDX42 [Drosophila guanche]